MKTRLLLFALGAAAFTSAAGTLAACATNESVSAEPEPDGSKPELDAGSDGSPEADAPCTDCENFPEECTADALCIQGPFDPKSSAAGLDWRTQVQAITGRSANDVWLAGTAGAAAHFDGTSWTRSDVGTKETLRALWLRDGAEISFGVVESIFTRGLDPGDAGAPSPGGWTARGSASTPPGYGESYMELSTAWGTADAPWLWVATTSLSGGTSGLWRMRMTPDSKFEVNEVVESGYCVVTPCSEILALHGSSADDLWGVGPKGAAIRVTAAQSDAPKVEGYNSLTARSLNGVWAAAADDVWAVGASGIVRRYRGDPRFWEVVSGVPTNQTLNAVWGSSSSDLWVIGEAGLVLHYDGTTWTRVKIAGLGRRRPSLTSVWVPAPGKVWIGGQGVVLSLGGKP